MEARGSCTLLLCLVAGMALQASARATGMDICTSGFLSTEHMKKLVKVVNKVPDDQHNFRILPNTDEMRHHVLKQDEASVCLFRKAVAELYVAAFNAAGTLHFMNNGEARKERGTFHSFVQPSCGTTQEGEQDATFKKIMARLADAKRKVSFTSPCSNNAHTGTRPRGFTWSVNCLQSVTAIGRTAWREYSRVSPCPPACSSPSTQIPSDEAMLRKVLRETELLPIACTERADREKPSGGRRRGGGGKRQWRVQKPHLAKHQRRISWQ
uniref:Uncharacterized protein LOC116947453 isoform X1 n=1 Tax=Petromyzon marinus TaxID=7757 RepID=A0AAJ7TJM7_PETMA|nr:uncharacterized protein LOC116947453 isoform X1 [Petromyzon marinus]